MNPALAVIDAQLARLAEIFANPMLVVALLVCGTIYVAMVARDQSRPWALGLLIFVSCCAPATDFFDRWLQPPFPFDSLVLYGRTITAMMLVLVTLTLTFTFRPVADSRLPVPALWMVLLQIALCVRLLVSGFYGEAGARVLVFMMIFASFAVFMNLRIQTADDMRRFARVIGLAFAFYIAATIMVMVLDFYAVSIHSRFFGITGNPNHNAMVIAIMMPAALGLMNCRAEPRRWQFVWMAVVGASVVPLILSGSRGGMLTAMFGAVIFYRHRLGPMAVAVVPIFLGAYITAELFGADIDVFGRYTNTGGADTRTYVWRQMLEVWLSNPIFGVAGDMSVQENAYLGTLMRTGVIGLAILVILTYTIIRLSILCIARRASLGHYAPLADAAIAGLAAVAINSMFEATFFSNLNQSVFLIYSYMVLLSAAVRISETQPEVSYYTGTPFVASRLTQ